MNFLVLLPPGDLSVSRATLSGIEVDSATVSARAGTTKPLRTALLACALGAFAAGCAETTVSLSSGFREYVPSDYPLVLKRWTRSQSLITLAELDDQLTVTSTYESWDFRWAYVIRYASDYRLTIEQRRQLLDKTLAETADTHEFYVALYGTNRRWTDLSRPNSSWTVRLIDDQGDETAPSSVDVIVKPGPLERRYFPYTSVWRQAFRIKFPAAHDGHPTVAKNARWLGLRFAGAEGNEELRWQIEQAEPPAVTAAR